MSNDRILIVDDEANARTALRIMLQEEGYDAAEAADGVQAMALIGDLAPSVVLSDVRMPNMDGIELLKNAKASGADCVFIMMTAFGTVNDAVLAMRAGAENFLIKPLDVGAVTAMIEKALEKRRLLRETQTLRERVKERFSFPNIIGTSPELQTVFDIVQRAAPTKATVLILGESGTGKELVAQALHEQSSRHARPFVKVNCAALSETLLESELFGHEKGSFTGAAGRREGRFELADGGSLFLDEVGEISPSVQVKLLRVLQEREFERVGGIQSLKVDVRMVAATNRNLAAEVKAGRFREDLYYRLNVVSVTLPSLRQRKGDIPALVGHFVEKYAESYGKKISGLAPGTLNSLLNHDWPGNVRELENVIERAVVLAPGTELTSDDLPAALKGPRPNVSIPADGTPLTPGTPAFATGVSLYDIEKDAILRTLESTGGSTTRAAEVLGISVRKIQYRLKEYASGKVPSPDEDSMG